MIAPMMADEGVEAPLSFHYFLNCNVAESTAISMKGLAADFLPQVHYRVFCSPGRSFHYRVVGFRKSCSLSDALIHIILEAGLDSVQPLSLFFLWPFLACMLRRHIFLNYFPYLESDFKNESLQRTTRDDHSMSFLKTSLKPEMVDVVFEAKAGSVRRMAGISELFKEQPMIGTIDHSFMVRRTAWERNAWSRKRVKPWNRAQQETWLTVGRQSMNAGVIFRQEDEPRDS